MYSEYEKLDSVRKEGTEGTDGTASAIYIGKSESLEYTISIHGC